MTTEVADVARVKRDLMTFEFTSDGPAWSVICRHCKASVPVECGDVTGMDLDGMIAAAQQAAGGQHPDHGTVRVGAFGKSHA